ncbi:Fungal trans [Geosmithia morbida]|uniref:Fungal trans n=1 Tax=Geosmithia morbida TaxID=1094350 RepID=A0A9P4Z141_9HYPO|nr:Fungal trans [Geosmithia morbida]KAF4126771.1 Fungal trans [Geosmithia morbida]
MDSKGAAAPAAAGGGGGGAGAGGVPATPAAPTPHPGGGAPTTTTTTPAIEEPTSCRECRRRRVKCDGTMPVCAVCTKYRRHCLYDKHSRTRLTRKQLTILETRLEKAEALLLSHFTETQLAEMMDGAAALPLGTRTPSPRSNAATGGAAAAPPPRASVDHPAPIQQQHMAPTPAPTQLNIGLEPPGTSSQDGSNRAYELAPSVADNFEWSEQDSSWSSAHGTGIMSSDEGRMPQAIMDGMASLSVGERRGYLGSASGVALLRQILSARREGDVSPQQLEQLFQQQSEQSQWFRAQSMLSRVAVENLIDAFFALYHPTFPIVHEPTFRAQYAGILPRQDKDKWNVLANILTALGSFVSSGSADATDLPIFQAVQKGLFADNLETGNLTLVQAFGLSANYLQKRNKPNTGYNYGGLALRLGIGLGLHKEFDSGNVSPLQMEIRRRVWWCLCVLDVGATISYGRPLNWPQAGVEATFPKNIHEKDLVSDSEDYPPEVDELTLYTYVRVQSAYHLITMNVYNRLITGTFPAAAELVSLDDQYIGSWLSQVPHYYQVFPPPGSAYSLGVGISQWRYRNLRIVMYRPFLVRWALSNAAAAATAQPSAAASSSSSSTESLAVFRCLDAAKESIASIEEYWNTRSHSRLAAWYVLYFLFHATLIPVHCLRHSPEHPFADDWRAQVQSSVAVMESMSELNTNSSKCRDISTC